MTPRKSSETETLFPEVTCLIGGEEITVSPYTFGQMGRALNILVPLSSAIEFSSVLEVSKINFAVFLYAVTDKDCEGAFELVSMAVGKPVEWVMGLPGENGTRLLGTVFEVAIKPMLAELKKLAPPAPENPPATDGQT